MAIVPGGQYGVACGVCGDGTVYFEACPDHEWAVASECQKCGERVVIGTCRTADCRFGEDEWLAAEADRIL